MKKLLIVASLLVSSQAVASVDGICHDIINGEHVIAHVTQSEALLHIEGSRPVIDQVIHTGDLTSIHLKGLDQLMFNCFWHEPVDSIGELIKQL